jgi:hypothetical protein
MAKTPFFKFLPLVFLCSTVFAYEGEHKEFFVYLHPMSLAHSMFSSPKKDTFIYLTMDYSLNEFYSLIINPSFVYSDNLGSMTDSDGSSNYYSRIGSGVGIRRYISDKFSEGFYLQLMPGVYRFKIDYTSGIIIDILGYIGYSVRFPSGTAFFLDMGLGVVGYGWNSLPSDDAPFWLLAGSPGCHIRSMDYNIGIGFSF